MNHQTALDALHQATEWHKSSHSQGPNNCVEITASVPGWVGIRDSKLGAASPILAVTTAEWRALITGVRAGELSD